MKMKMKGIKITTILINIIHALKTDKNLKRRKSKKLKFQISLNKFASFKKFIKLPISASSSKILLRLLLFKW